MPTFVGPGGREWNHIALVLERVAVEDRRWPLTPGAILTVGPTGKMVGLNWHQSSEAARSELAPMLSVPDPGLIAGRTVLVYDDVFTSGTTLREVSLKLQAAGALRVDGVVLARQPFRGCPGLGVWPRRAGGLQRREGDRLRRGGRASPVAQYF